MGAATQAEQRLGAWATRRPRPAAWLFAATATGAPLCSSVARAASAIVARRCLTSVVPPYISGNRWLLCQILFRATLIKLSNSAIQ